MKILVHAYQTSPIIGSEFSVAWNYIMQMAQKHELYVLVGQTSYQMNDFSGLENIKIPNVTFIKISSDSFLCKLLNLFYKKSFTSPTFYMYYRYWEYQAYRTVKKLKIDFDIIHQLGPIGYREPGYLHKFNKPFIWGPIGGITRIKTVFIKKYNGFEKIKGVVKNVVNYLQFNFSRRIHHVFERADCLIAATSEQKNMINNLLKKDKCQYFPENVLKHIPIIPKDSQKDRKLSVLWIGSLECRKMPFLFIDAIRKTTHKEYLRCTMIGSGPLYDRIEKYIRKYNLSEIFSITGQMPRDKVLMELEKSDFLVITSAVEASTTIIWEAMENCVPVITLAHCGMNDIVSDNVTGFKIPIQSYDEICGSIAEKIDLAAFTPSLVKVFKENIIVESKKYLPEVRINFFESCYQKAVQNFSERNK